MCPYILHMWEATQDKLMCPSKYIAQLQIKTNTIIILYYYIILIKHLINLNKCMYINNAIVCIVGCLTIRYVALIGFHNCGVFDQLPMHVIIIVLLLCEICTF